jgi:hypothetical protein
MKRRFLVGALVAISTGLLANVAVGVVPNQPKSSPGEPKLDSPVIWSPSMNSVPYSIPEGAVAKGVKNGSATIRCRVTVAGSVGECTLVKEAPEGSGIGKAALNMAPKFLFNPPMREGKPVETMIDVVVPWALAEGESTGTHVARGDTSVGAHTNYSHVLWTAAPSYNDLVAATPAKAKAANVAGTAILQCAFADGGKLSGCSIASEQPAGYGFADAALSLANRFQAPAKAADGKSTKGAWVTVSVLFPPGIADGTAQHVTSVQWIAAPTQPQYATIYPQKAKSAGVMSGPATLSCTVETDGGLKDCGIAAEAPADMGFGRSALAAAPAFVMKTWSDNGEPMVGRKINFPISLQMKGAAVTGTVGAPVKP